METQIKNDQFTADIEKTEGCIVKFSVHLNSKCIEGVRREAIKRVNKGVSVPGFRKGKAPEGMLLKQFGKYIDEEWEYLIGHEALKGCVDLSKLNPLNDKAIERPKVKSFSLENGAEVEVTYEHTPVVPEIELSELSVKKIIPEAVKENDIAESIDNLRKSSTTWDKITERSIELGDVAVLDVFSVENPENAFYKDQLFEVTEEKMGAWMRKLLLGKNAGDVVEGESELDEKASEEEKSNFQSIKMKINIKEVRLPVIPDLNEELAKRLGFDSVEKLQEHVVNKLTKEMEQESDAEQMKHIEDLIIEKYGFDIPKTLFESQREQKLRERIEKLSGKDLSREEILEKEEEIEKEVAEEVTKMIHLYYIFRNIGEKIGVVVTQEEVNEHLKAYQYLDLATMGGAQLNNLRLHAEDVVWNKKIREYLKENVAITE
jgi:trigger factor